MGEQRKIKLYLSLTAATFVSTWILSFISYLSLWNKLQQIQFKGHNRPSLIRYSAPQSVDNRAATHLQQGQESLNICIKILFILTIALQTKYNLSKHLKSFWDITLQFLFLFSSWLSLCVWAITASFHSANEQRYLGKAEGTLDCVLGKRSSVNYLSSRSLTAIK